MVLDGYNASNDTFHIDLGWGPGGDNENGNHDWYSLPTIAGFTTIDTIIYNITPPAPTVMNVSSPTASGTYGAGTTIPITVTFNEPVTVNTTNGTPQLTLNDGGGGQLHQRERHVRRSPSTTRWQTARTRRTWTMPRSAR